MTCAAARPRWRSTSKTRFEKAAELDLASPNGLTGEATRSLNIACNALAKQMSEDFKAGTLDQDRMEMLIGSGIGAHAVGTALWNSSQ